MYSTPWTPYALNSLDNLCTLQPGHPMYSTAWTHYSMYSYSLKTLCTLQPGHPICTVYSTVTHWTPYILYTLDTLCTLQPGHLMYSTLQSTPWTGHPMYSTPCSGLHQCCGSGSGIIVPDPAKNERTYK